MSEGRANQRRRRLRLTYASHCNETYQGIRWFQRYQFCKMTLVRWQILTFVGLVTCAGSLLSQSAPIAITDTPPDGTVGLAYSFQFTASEAVGVGGTGQYTWQWFPLSPGAIRGHAVSQIPPGLTLNSGGLVTGPPTQAGSFAVTVQVTDSNNPELFTFQNFTITVAVCTPSFITTSVLSSGDVGVAYSQAVNVTGCTAPYSFSLPSGGNIPNVLPPGLSLGQSGTAAVITGTPTTANANPYTFTLMVKESYGGTASAPFSLTVNPPLALGATSPLPTATVGQPYSQSLMPAGGTTPYYSITWDKPVPDMTLDSPGALIHGTPTSKDIGQYQFTATLTDNILAQVQKTFQLSIVPSQPLLQVSPLSLDFSAVAGGDTPPAQAISVAPATAASSTFTVLTDAGQVNTKPPFTLAVTPSSGTAPAQLIVSADQTGLQAGKTSGRIRILDQINNETDVTVNLTVTAPSTPLQVVPSMLHFAARSQAPGTLEQDLAITGTGGPIGFSITAVKGSSWITSLTPASGQTVRNSAALVRVLVNTQGLTVGSYNDTIHISYTGGSVDVPISLFVASSGPILGLNVTGLRYQAQQGGVFSNPQTVKILNLGDPSATVNWTATLVSGSDTVALGASSGIATTSSPGLLPINLAPNATQLSPGGHYALISISDPNALNSPVYLVVVLDLAASGSTALPDPNPAGLFFVVAASGAASASQNVTVNTSSAQAVAFQVASSTADGGKWLVVNPASGQTSGATPGTFGVSVNPANLTAGIYSGKASVSIGGAVRTVNVTVVVLPAGSTVGTTGANAEPAALEAHPRAGTTCTPSKLALTETGLVNNFSIPAGWPATLIVQLNDDCANAVANGSVIASFSNGDSPVSLASNGQGASYSATWQPGTSSSQMLVTLNATAGTLAPASMQLAGGIAQNLALVPSLAAGGTLNNVNPVVGAPLAPGTIAQVYGANLASSSVSPGVIPVPTTFNGTFALVGPMQVPLYFLSNGQLDIQIPSELAANQQYPIVASVNGALTVPDLITVVPDTPGVVSYLDGAPPNVQEGAHIIAQHNADYSLVNDANPAKAGEYVTMYLVGMGATNPAVASGTAAPSGPLAQLVDQPTLTVGGQVVSGGNIAFAGLTPGSVGLYQITFQVPSGLSAPDADVVVTQNGRSSNTTKLPVGQ
jgi:uncharacterized protein (TIGR03437 family)